jgi:hypothetical protein
MPARDMIHDTVKTALINDGWIITHDPFKIRLGDFRVYADLGAEQPLAAEKENRRIVVEIKSFAGPSLIEELEKAIGQFGLYRALLTQVEPERMLYLAVSEPIWVNMLDSPAGRVVVEHLGLKVIVVALESQEIVKWID